MKSVLSTTSISGVSIYLSAMDGNYFVKKKVFDNHGQRLLFVAGLEGTGHHGWHGMIKTCVQQSYCKDTASDFTPAVIDRNSNGYFGLFSNYQNGDDKLNELYAMFEMVYNRTTVNENNTATVNQIVHILGLALGYNGPYIGMLSYPNGDTHEKSLMNPDIIPVAVFAEHFHADFRFIVLLRDEMVILRSVNKRGFGGSLESKILVASALQLHSQMMAVDRSFYHCVEYEHFSHLTVAEIRIMKDFIHPQISDQHFSEMLKSWHKNSIVINNKTTTTTFGLENRRNNTDLLLQLDLPYSRYHIAQFYLQMSKIRRLCNSQ